jgi:septal ring factor EnvC (AmiA/AmiB activator)
MTKSDHYTQLILEEIRDQNRALLEGQQLMLGMPAKVNKIEGDVSELKTDMKAVKAALQATNLDVKDHEKRITKLENTTYTAA